MLLSDMKADKPKHDTLNNPFIICKHVGRLPTGRCSPDEHHAAAAAGTIQAAGNFVQAYRNTPKQEPAAPLIEEQGAWLIMSPIFMLTAVYQCLPLSIMQFLQGKGRIVRCARIDTERWFNEVAHTQCLHLCMEHASSRHM